MFFPEWVFSPKQLRLFSSIFQQTMRRGRRVVMLSSIFPEDNEAWTQSLVMFSSIFPDNEAWTQGCQELLNRKKTVQGSKLDVPFCSDTFECRGKRELQESGVKLLLSSQSLREAIPDIGSYIESIKKNYMGGQKMEKSDLKSIQEPKELSAELTNILHPTIWEAMTPIDGCQFERQLTDEGEGGKDSMLVLNTNIVWDDTKDPPPDPVPSAKWLNDTPKSHTREVNGVTIGFFSATTEDMALGTKGIEKQLDWMSFADEESLKNSECPMCSRLVAQMKQAGISDQSFAILLTHLSNDSVKYDPEKPKDPLPRTGDANLLNRVVKAPPENPLSRVKAILGGHDLGHTGPG